MYVCMHVIYVHTYLCTYIFINKDTQKHPYTFNFTRKHMCTYTGICMCILNTYLYMCVCVKVFGFWA